MGVQPSGLQKPKTPNVTPSKLPSGIAVMMGVDRTDSSSRANAVASRIVRGVAGRNMAAAERATAVAASERSTRWWPAPSATRLVGSVSPDRLRGASVRHRHEVSLGNGKRVSLDVAEDVSSVADVGRGHLRGGRPGQLLVLGTSLSPPLLLIDLAAGCDANDESSARVAP